MTEQEYKEFMKRYDKFKKNNLPTPFWDEERQTYEYVFKDRPILNNFDEIVVHSDLTSALEQVAWTGFYYSFNHKIYWSKVENGKTITWTTGVGHNHAHSFEEVVQHLYNYPESFNLEKDDEQFYSKQELDYLRRVQKYLLFIGLKDIENRRKQPVARYRNKLHNKYKNAWIYKQRNELINKISNGEINYRVIDWYPKYSGEQKYKQKSYRGLIVDGEDNFKFFVEFTHEEVKTYKEIKDKFKIKDKNDDDKLILIYFNILERF